jgi:hypothetical protein
MMRGTLIEQAEGYIGAHSPKLNVGDTQLMVFQPQDSGRSLVPLP